MTNKNTFNLSFIIAIIIHLCSFVVWNIFSTSVSGDKFKLSRMKIIPVSEYENTIEDNNFKDKESSPKDLNKITEEKESDIKEKETKDVPNSKDTSTKMSGGGAEILTSLKGDPTGSDTAGSFTVPEIKKGEKEGIGIGDKGEGLGEIDPELVDNQQTEVLIKVDKEKILKDYLFGIFTKIEKNKVYPEEARSEGIEGKVKVEFIVEKNGRVKNIKVISSSGYKILDNAAMDAVKKSSPFLNILAEMEKESLNMKLAIIFTLELKNY